MLDRLIDQHLGLPARAIRPEQGHEGLLALVAVLAKALTDGRRVARYIEEIVGDLKSQPKVLRIAPKAQPLLGPSPAKHRATFDRPADQRSRLQSLQPRNRFHVCGLVCRQQIEHLPARHPECACRMSEVPNQLDTDFCKGVRRRVGQDLERQRQQGVTGKDRSRLVERDVHRRFSAAKVIIVHARQIVVDQRMDMDALDSEPGSKRQGSGNVEQVGGGARQQGPKALTSAYCGVTHGVQKAGARVGGLDQHLFEHGVDIRRNPRKRLINAREVPGDFSRTHARAIRLKTVVSFSDPVCSTLIR